MKRRLTTSQRVLAGLALGTVTVIAMMTFTALELNRAIDDERWVAHTYQVLRALDDLGSALNRAEAAQRAYLITGSQDYYVARDGAMGWAESLFIEVAELTQDNPRQRKRMPDLELALQAKLDAMNDLMAIGPNGSRESIRQSIRQDDADNAKINALTSQMRAEENRLLLERNAKVQRNSFLIPLVMLAAFAVFIVTESAFFLRIRHDILERERAEAQARDARGVAEQATRSKSEFLANMSHEIRTPLNAIMGLTHLALDSELTADQRDNLLKVSRSSLAMRNILNDILDYSKIEAGRLDVEIREVEIEAVLSAASDLFYPAAEEKGLAFHIEIAPEVPARMMGDELRIGQVLNNLIGNAIKFTQAGEIRIVAATFTHGGKAWLNVTVLDTGAGIAPDQLDRLFDAFAQADSSISRRFGGTGLGLTISRRLVTLMGGTMGVSSQLGRGSRFHFSLPLAAVETRPERPDLGAIKALVVDDQVTAAQIICTAIRAAKGEAAPMTDPTQTIPLLQDAADRGTPYNLVVLDWMMPDQDGVALAGAIEAWAQTKGCTRPLTIMMMTAHGRDRLTKAARSVHIDSILSKPILPSTLYRAIRAAMHPEDAEAAPKTAMRASDAFEGARVLLVEDNALNQAVASKILKRSGIDVSIASSGLEAIDLVTVMSFDAILMDLQMPQMDGLETTRRIRQLPRMGSVPIIALTAAALPAEQQACREAGMNDHVAKPIIPGELFAALARWIELPEERDAGRGAEFPDLAGIDRASLIDRLGGDRALLDSLLRQFVDQNSGVAEAIRSAIGRSENQKAVHLAHALAGVSGNLSAIAVSKLSRKIEAAAAHGMSPDLDRQLSELDGSLSDLIATIGAYLQALPKTQTRPDLDRAAIGGLFDCLEREDFDALERFADLRETLEQRHGAGLAGVSDAIAGLRFTEALNLLRDLEPVG